MNPTSKNFSKRSKTEQTVDSLALENQICFPVYASSRLMTALYRPLLAGIGLTYTRYLVMLVLWEADGIALKEIGRRLLLDSGTLTPLLRALEKQGLLKRRKDPHDERNLIVLLTAKGRALRKKAACIPGQLLKKTGASPSDVDRLKKELDRLIFTLQEAVSV